MFLSIFGFVFVLDLWLGPLGCSESTLSRNAVVALKQLQRIEARLFVCGFG
jgi:hypothetical protein